jgi:hypothetical protein
MTLAPGLEPRINWFSNAGKAFPKCVKMTLLYFLTTTLLEVSWRNVYIHFHWTVLWLNWSWGQVANFEGSALQIASSEPAKFKSEFYKLRVCHRVARWFTFIPKIPVWVNFGGPWNGKCWYILWPFGIFTALWYNLWSFGIVCGKLVYLTLVWQLHFRNNGKLGRFLKKML